MASKINNFIYLGGQSDAENKKALEHYGITHIINVADDVKNFFPGKFTYCNLQVADFGADKGIARTFPQAFDFLKKRAETDIFLIHCFAGMNRSVTVTIAVLMEFFNWDLITAYVHVRTCRPGVCPFVDNRKQLVQWELNKYGANSMTIEEFSKFKELQTRVEEKGAHL